MHSTLPALILPAGAERRASTAAKFDTWLGQQVPRSPTNSFRIFSGVPSALASSPEHDAEEAPPFRRWQPCRRVPWPARSPNGLLMDESGSKSAVREFVMLCNCPESERM